MRYKFSKNTYKNQCDILYLIICIIFKVEDQVPHCETIYEERCENKTVGYTAEIKCDSWPKEVCHITNEPVTKYTPETFCEKVPHKLCAPIGCDFVEVYIKVLDNF